MRSETVSVLVPHFGCEAYLRAAVSSVLTQTQPAAEIIVVDDCSPTSAWLNALAPFRGESRIRLFQTTQRVGPYRIANAVLPRIEGSCLAFQDADDVSHPDRFRRQLHTLEAAAADIVGCRFVCIDRHGSAAGWWQTRRLWKFLHQVRRNRIAHHPTCLSRRETVQSLGGFDGTTTFGADSDFMWRAARAFKIVNTPEVLYYYRLRSDSLTGCPATGTGSRARCRYKRELKQRMRAARTAGSCVPTGGLRARPNDVRVELVPIGL